MQNRDAQQPEIRPLTQERTPRRQPRTPNPEARQRLLDAAQEILAEKGYQSLRVEEVTSRAGLSVGTFYLYFESKEDVVVTLVTAAVEEIRERIAASHQGARSVLEELHRGLAAYFDYVDNHRLTFLLLRDASQIETTVGALSDWALETVSADLREVLDRGVERGEVRPMDTQMLAEAINGLIATMAGWWLGAGRRSRREVETFINQLIGLGIVPR